MFSYFHHVELFETPQTAVHQTAGGCHALLQGIFMIQGSNMYLLHWQILDHWATWETLVNLSSYVTFCFCSHSGMLCTPMDCSTSCFPILHYHSEFAQTHVHWVDDAIRPSQPLSLPTSPALSLSQHQGLFQWISSLLQVAKILEFQLQHQYFQWIFRVNIFWEIRIDLDLLAVQGTHRIFSRITVWKNQFSSTQTSLWSSSHNQGVPGGSEVKASAFSVGDLGSIPGSGNPLEKEMETHSRILAWRIAWTEEPAGLQSTGSQRARQDWTTSLHFTFTTRHEYWKNQSFNHMDLCWQSEAPAF